MKLKTFAGLALACLGIAVGSPVIAAPAASPAPAVIPAVPDLGGQLNRQRGPLRVIGRNPGLYGSIPSDASNLYGYTSRVSYTTGGSVTVVQVCPGNGQIGGAAAGSEGVPGTPTIYRAAVEYGVTSVVATKNGNPEVVTPAGGSSTISCFDPVGVTIPAHTQFWVRLFAMVPKYPTIASAAAVTGGSLTAATTYYYEATTTYDGIESAPSPEVSCTTGATLQLGCTLQLTPYTYNGTVDQSANGGTINIYRATTSGGEKLLSSIPGKRLSYTDLGYDTVSTTVAPPSYTAYINSRYAQAGDSANNFGGNGSNQVAATGQFFNLIGPNIVFLSVPAMVLGDDTTVPSIGDLSDSIGFGTGISANLYPPFASFLTRWFDAGITAGSPNSISMSIPSTHICDIVSNKSLATSRMVESLYVDYVVSNLSVNDVGGGESWQTFAACQMSVAQQFSSRGIRYILTTLTPYGTTTDNGLTIANQTQSTNEAQRLGYNAWVRAGSPVVAGSPVAPGTAGAVSSPYVWSHFDAANVVEVNASNVLTQNGGFYQVPTTSSYTGALTGSPTTTSLTCGACNFPVNSATVLPIATWVVQMTSGAQAGKVAVIQTNTATGLTLYPNGSNGLTGVPMEGFTTAPASGDAFAIWQTCTPDFVHPTRMCHQAIGAAWATWVTANIVPFGATTH